MIVTPDAMASAIQARDALLARNAELQKVLDHWASVLAAAAVNCGPVRPVRNLLCASRIDEVLPRARADERTLYRAASARHDAPLAAGNDRHGADRPVRQAGRSPVQRARGHTGGVRGAGGCSAAAVAVTGFLPAGHGSAPGMPPGMPSGYEPVRDGLAGGEECEHPARWPSLTTAPHSSQTRHAQQAGSPPSPASLDPAGDRAWLAARR